MGNTNSYSGDYTIEAGVKIPGTFAGRRGIYPFGKMKIGEGATDRLGRVRAAASYFGKRHKPKKFSIILIDPVKKTYRCWRTA